MQTSTIPSRIVSIDIFRALTMLLMIFVNSLGSLSEIPTWLGHANWNDDALGLADIVFPCFLFIVGMSVPFAIKSRQNKGESTQKIIVHIVIRSLALLIMGVFHENINRINAELSGMNWALWQFFVNLSFILVWNVYPENRKFKLVFASFKVFGIVSLIILALLFRGGDLENPEYFKPHWWGILGLIGWTYLISSIIYILAKGKMHFLILFFLFFITINMLYHAGILEPINLIPKICFEIIAMVAITLAGIIASKIYIAVKENNKLSLFFLITIGISILTFLAAIYTRQLWELSKLRATPAWVFISISISFLVFSLLFFICDVKKHQNIFQLIKPAGTNTLLCYLLPYLYASIISFTHWQLPPFFNTGIVGLIRIFIVAMLIIFAAGWFEKKHIKMKL